MPRIALTALTVALLAIPAVGGSAMAAPTCGGQPATIVGNPWSEFILGTRGNDVIVADAGNDVIVALSGDDIVCGGPGRDTLIGGRGADQLFGEEGNDRLLGQAGFDMLDGGDGRDRCRVGRDGGTETDCATDGSGGSFDLSVSVDAPAHANAEADFAFTVVVRNVGSGPSGAYTLVLDESHSDVDCGFDPSGSIDRPALGVGDSYQRTVTYAAGCVVTGSGDGHVSLDASVQYSGTDTDHSNDSASDSVVIDPPSGG